MYHELSTQEVMTTLQSRLSGLTSEEARSRLSQYGNNELERTQRISKLQLFISQFTDPIMLILIVATIISFFLKEVLDALVILAILLLNALLGFFQEYKAEKSIELLQKLSVPKTKTYRDGVLTFIESSELV